MLQLFVDYTDDAIDNGVNQNATVNLNADAILLSSTLNEAAILVINS